MMHTKLHQIAYSTNMDKSLSTTLQHENMKRATLLGLNKLLSFAILINSRPYIIGRVVSAYSPNLSPLKFVEPEKRFHVQYLLIELKFIMHLGNWGAMLNLRVVPEAHQLGPLGGLS